ncbi:hypothetical protein [Yersinia ruckeri]|uniref:hypothetical protein n=1 Tax=Yersinia ruckeri TaxID=29486 RepID=UPI0020C04486|nr:hypothetical protein [Yersinia ruckeri]EKN4689539.1 hypothetical protein [Yersinia ruckeri]MCK8586566.1 hypothetical protein [Yersinia ruckeri]MCW6615843.1 hypothetical protein [Yersinia ruckeri]
MTLKKRPLKPAANLVSPEDAERFAERFADRVYGEEKKPVEKIAGKVVAEKMIRTTITIPESLLREVEGKAFENKQAGIEPKNISAVFRAGADMYLKGSTKV